MLDLVTHDGGKLVNIWYHLEHAFVDSNFPSRQGKGVGLRTTENQYFPV